MAVKWRLSIELQGGPGTTESIRYMEPCCFLFTAQLVGIASPKGLRGKGRRYAHTGSHNSAHDISSVDSSVGSRYQP